MFACSTYRISDSQILMLYKHIRTYTDIY